jgi:hypothetical protein
VFTARYGLDLWLLLRLPTAVIVSYPLSAPELNTATATTVTKWRQWPFLRLQFRFIQCSFPQVLFPRYNQIGWVAKNYDVSVNLWPKRPQHVTPFNRRRSGSCYVSAAVLLRTEVFGMWRRVSWLVFAGLFGISYSLHLLGAWTLNPSRWLHCIP